MSKWWAFQRHWGGAREVVSYETLAGAQRHRAGVKEDGDSCGPIVEIEVPDPEPSRESGLVRWGFAWYYGVVGRWITEDGFESEEEAYQKYGSLSLSHSCGPVMAYRLPLP